MNFKALTVGAVVGFVLALSPACGGGSGAQATCDANSCATGCCDARGTCVTATTESQCGTQGQNCVACAAGRICQAGNCTDAPDAGTCPNGCCAATQPDACCKPNGTPLPGNHPDNCGTNGDPCQKCAPGEECVDVDGAGPKTSGACRAVTPSADPYGEPCDNPSQCTSVPVQDPANRMCKTETTFGNLTYQGGYCTRRCYDDTHCGAAGLCLVGLGELGEADNICLERCTSNADCRSGYACFNFGTQANPEGACWLRSADGGLMHERVDAGPGANAGVMGGVCTADGQCQPPADGFCIAESLPDGGSTGFTGGSCTADCTYGGQEHCGSGGACVLFRFGTNPEVAEIGGLCMSHCGGTAGACRSGYACEPYFSNTEGFCFPP